VTLPAPTAGPTSTPAPTATPVSEEEFLSQYSELVDQLKALGVSESIYRDVVRAQLCRDKLIDALTEELPISRTTEKASVFLITATNEESANEVQAMVKSDGFLTAWNTIVSRPIDPDATDAPATDAYELQWRTRENLSSSVSPEVASAAFDLDLNTPSDIIPAIGADGKTTYYIIMVNGREQRDMTETELQTAQANALSKFVDEQLAGNLKINDVWRSRVPTLPALDPKFLAAPTATPVVTAAPALPTTESESGDGE
ncbi:MAG TPA: hypothetical protein PKJ56_01370, partial [Promineifilum sp.]|nr:hypothetical protein [Promineifilum sp.]